MKPGEAVMKLTALGYRFEAAGVRLRWRFEGQNQPDPRQVRPLLQMGKGCKEEALFFLQCFSSKCGGARPHHIRKSRSSPSTSTGAAGPS